MDTVFAIQFRRVKSVPVSLPSLTRSSDDYIEAAVLQDAIIMLDYAVFNIHRLRNERGVRSPAGNNRRTTVLLTLTTLMQIDRKQSTPDTILRDFNGENVYSSDARGLLRFPFERRASERASFTRVENYNNATRLHGASLPRREKAIVG